MSTQPLSQEQPRAEARKAQVLEAATECFRRNGFHGASMAQISKTAGMSVGHIYHYFENKEAIIAAIVEGDLTNLLTITERIRKNGAGGDVLRAMVDDVDNCADDVTNDKNAPLMLEIVAEAARNPHVAAIIHKADQAAMDHMRKLFRDGLQFRGQDCTDSELDGPISLMAALFEGFTIRLIRNPDLDIKAYLPALRSVTEHILETLIAKPETKPE